MAECDECGEYENLPYQCHRCGQTFCADHRLPENHDCPGLDGWNDPDGVFESDEGGVFESEFDDSVRNRGGSDDGVLARVRSALGLGGSSDTRSSGRTVGSGTPGVTDTGLVGYFRGNVTYTVLAVMLVTFLFQYVVFPLAGVQPGSPLWRATFVLSSAHPEYVWTWITSIFAHGGFNHILFNGIALYFFGPVVERRVGSKRFTALFLLAGAAAGLAQIGTNFLMGAQASGVVGASGAIMAIMGVLTVLRPGMKVYLYFLIPVPLWLLTFGFAGFSVIAGFSSFGGASNVAHLAHLAGLAIGLAYGTRVKGERAAPEQLRLGGGPGGPGGPGRGRL